eukprot:c13539_g1_i1.p1 GENE.c13539_g1_i1~~c13539_g1_i1.p1  ORF type:complete len:281 (+),score=107.12 c13539_g1_i1:29-844(+)
MSYPTAPVLLKDATIDQYGILVSWIPPANCEIDTYTVSWKADAWWTAAQATVPSTMTEYLISDLPPNSKINVYIYSTNSYGSSSWSDTVEFISSRDETALPDILSESDLSADVLFKVMYTPECDKFALDAGLLSNIEQISLEEKDGCLHKTIRVTPPVPERIKGLLQSYIGSQVITYEEVSIKNPETKKITFKIQNIPYVGSYVEIAEGTLNVIEVGPNKSRIEGHFDLRINYPVVGYYLAQVIRSQVISGLSKVPTFAKKYVDEVGLPSS